MERLITGVLLMLQYNIFYTQQNGYDDQFYDSYKTIDEALYMLDQLVNDRTSNTYKIVIQY